MRQRLGPNATGREGAAEPADLRLVPSAVAAWLGTLAGLHASPGAQKGLAIAAAVLALLAIAGIRSGPGRLAVGMALAAALAGLAGGAARAAAVHEGPVAELSAARAQVSVAAVVTSDPSLRAGEESESGEPYVVARLRVERIVGRGVTTEVRTPVVLVASDPGWASVLPGTPVSLSGRLAPADGGPVAAFLRSGEPPRPTGRPGITSRLTEPFREGLRVAVGGLPPAAQGIVPGMAVGDESRLPPDLRRAMQETGLTHLTAVSGVHVSVVLIAVLGLARWAGVRGYGLPVVAVVSIVGFAALVRPEPSVVRASTMGLIGIVGLTAAGRKRALPALAAAVLALLLLDPWLAVSIGFALSVLSTAGILLLAPVWRDALPWVPRPAAEAIAVPMSAQAASLPVLVAFVSETSLAALPANVLVAPAVAPATLLGVLAAAVSPVFPTAAAAAAWLAGWPARWIAVVAERGASLPGAVVRWPEGAAGVVAASVLVLLLIVALPRLLRRRPLSVAAAAMALALLVGAPSPGWPPRGWLVVACPVGQGDAFVIHAGPASAVVVDAGPDPDRVDRCLDELGVTHVHLLVLTHFHADHVEGLPGVLQGRRVDEVMVSPLAEPAELAASVASWLAGANVPTTIAAAGERRLTGSVELRVIWPVRIIGRGEPAANDASVVVQAAVGGIDVLMTGDVEPLAQRAIERAEPDLRADVLKVPHHGSRFQEPDWLVRVGAEVALIGVGEGNRHGHPAADTVRTLEQAGAAVYRTDQDGAIAVVRTPDGLLGVTTRGAGVFAQRRRADVVRLSGRRDILGRMPPKDVPVTLAVGPEALLAERAVAAVARKARAADPDADLTEVAGGQLSTPALNEHLSPSLFTTRRVVVVHDVQDVPEATGEALVGFCRAPIEDVSLVLLHPGGVKGKRLLDSLRRAGAREVACDRLTRADDQVEFVRSEVAVHGGRIEQAAARALVEAIGGDLRGLASAAAQLAADADGGVISSGAVATYFEGRAEVKGWVVADRAVEGRTADALEQLRWALETGTDPVLVTAALATALRSLARLSGAPRGVRDADIARDLGVPPWKVRMLRSQLRGWTPGGLMRAIRAVAEADLQVKGAGNDPTLALTTAIVEVGVARAA